VILLPIIEEANAVDEENAVVQLNIRGEDAINSLISFSLQERVRRHKVNGSIDNQTKKIALTYLISIELAKQQTKNIQLKITASEPF
jgi:hypothetical protein